VGSKRVGKSGGGGSRNKKPGAGGPADRAARIARGKDVLKAVQDRIDEIEAKRPSAGFRVENPVTQKTRTNYEKQEIENHSFRESGSVAELELCVQLAKLAARVKYDDGLSEAIVSGRLPLTRTSLAEFLKLEERETDEALQKYLDEQI
jgi:hypothetical protein